MRPITRGLLSASIIAFAGCATQGKLSDAEIANRYPQLDQLVNNLKLADEQEVDLLSAALFKQANNQYTEALTMAKTGDQETMQIAQGAQSTLAKANSSAARARDELAIVLNARTRALSAAAEKKNAKAFRDADEDLIEMGDMIAKGKIADVREDRQALAKRYSKLEVEALKSATDQEAAARISEAKKLGAEEFSPQTLAQAISELKLANNVLESNADAREKAADHAQKAYQSANRAIQITEIVKEFEQSEMTGEQIVLWYQRQLAAVVAPLGVGPDFGQPNKTLVKGLSNNIQTVLNQAKDNEQSLMQTQQLYASETANKNAERERQSEFEARFRTIQNSFTSSEAEVFRQGNNVLIRSYGFNFPSGSSEIQSDNFPLLKKIITAVGQFPESNIRVSGHTDNQGSDDMNMSLSSERAEKVGRFLVDVGNISKSRVNSVGYGETRPLASNETADGRTANRRVEILIIND